MLFRRCLIAIRKQYNTNAKQSAIYAALILVASSLVGVLLDVMLPFENLWWNSLRAIILIPITASFFFLEYMASLKLHDLQIERDPDWIPYRARFAPGARRRMAIVSAAFLLVLIYGLSYSSLYTLSSAFILSLAIGVFAFIRLTRKEQAREDSGIPDPRSSERDFKKRVQNLSEERLKRQKTKNKNKQIRREAVLRGRKKAEELRAKLDEKS